jgi:hypothetical protein
MLTFFLDFLGDFGFGMVYGYASCRHSVGKERSMGPEGSSYGQTTYKFDEEINETTTLKNPAPIMIKEQWVCCDRSHKWHLLPYEMNPSNRPKKWKCIVQQ